MPVVRPVASGALVKSRVIDEITGPTGPVGPQGAVGAAGVTGAQGPTGGMGQTGPQGITGVAGAQGPAGTTGAAGAQGITGSAGVQGPAGVTGEQGAAGIQGITGSAGAQGPAGTTGAAGTQGITGSAGVQGPAGTTGAVGAQGIQGITGSAGAQGPAGTTGAAGAQGITGSAGVQGPAGVTGAGGVTGLQGITGSAGAQGPAGTTGAAGTQGITGVQGTQGVQGPAGVTGAAGAQGITGQQGAQGPVGDTGPIGTTGEQGIVGPAGVTGPQGSAGPAGVTGAQGAAGAQGNTGTQGVQGNTGVQGAQGIQGNTGIQGASGVQGNTGTQGVQGAQGNTGSQGLQGNTGVQGAQGIQGNTGIQGASGVQGNTGTQGVQGAQGNTGAQGVQGIQGNTGVQGAQGNTGVQGTTGVQGNTGIQGVQGAQGNTGVQGAAGVQGNTGVQGSQGNTGIKGASGVQGNTGAQGVAGAQGNTGLQGITGVQGKTGAIGVTGSQGKTGEAGAQGPTGLLGDSLAHRVAFITGGCLFQGKTTPASTDEGFFLGAYTGGAWKTYFSIGNTGSYFKFTPGSAGVEFAGTFRTGLTGQRVEITSADKQINWYSAAGHNIVKIGENVIESGLDGLYIHSTIYGGGVFCVEQDGLNYIQIAATSQQIYSDATGESLFHITRQQLAQHPMVTLSELIAPTGLTKLLSGLVAGTEVCSIQHDGQFRGIPSAEYKSSALTAETGADKIYMYADSPKDTYSKLLLRGEGADGGTVITDECGKTATRGGNVHTDRDIRKNGLASLKFDGDGDYITFADSDDWYLGTGDFTIDYWVRVAAYPDSGYAATMVSQAVDVNNRWQSYLFNSSGEYHWSFHVRLNSSDTIVFHSNAVTVALNTWYHIALVRQGTTFTYYMNGVNIGSTADDSEIPNLSAALRIGSIAHTTDYDFNGWLDDVHVSKGIARWLKSFSPPTASLWHMPEDGVARILPNTPVTNRPSIMHYANQAFRIGPTNYPGYLGATGANTETSMWELQFSGYRDSCPDTLGAKIACMNLSTGWGYAASYGNLIFSTLNALPSTYDSTTEKARLTYDGRFLIGVTGSNEMFEVNGNGKVKQLLMTNLTPGTTGATGVAGCFAADDSYLYYKTSTGWKRIAIAGW